MPWNVLMQTLALTNSGESWQLSCLQKNAFSSLNIALIWGDSLFEYFVAI